MRILDRGGSLNHCHSLVLACCTLLATGGSSAPVLAAALDPGATGPPAASTGTRASAARLSGRGAAFGRLVRNSERPLVTPRTAFIVASGAALAGLATTFEDPAASARALEHAPWDGMSDLGNQYGNGAVLGAGALTLYALGRFTRRTGVQDAGFDAVRALGITFAGVGVLKLAVHRTRPDGGAYSFPSGHTAGAFAIAPVLAHHFGWRVGAPAYALAVMTGAGRLEDRHHYLSDVVFGAALGTAVGLAESESSAAPGMHAGVFATPDRIGLRVDF